MAGLLWQLVLLLLTQPGLLSHVLQTPARNRAAQEARWTRIPGGPFRPPYAGARGESEFLVEPFWLARDPVTNQEFEHFVEFFPLFRRGAIAPLFADAGYLADWAGPTEPGPNLPPDAPVVGVSWFAAKAFCESQGARLPTELEWELAAAASETAADGRNEPAWRSRILDWYSRPATVPFPTGHSPPNYYGVRDLHGLVWEWVLDFNSTMVSSDSRNAGGGDAATFCGAGALGFADAGDYAAFMRTAFRSSLRADYTAKALGFRCARSKWGDGAL